MKTKTNTKLIKIIIIAVFLISILIAIIILFPNKLPSNNADIIAPIDTENIENNKKYNAINFDDLKKPVNNQSSFTNSFTLPAEMPTNLEVYGIVPRIIETSFIDSISSRIGLTTINTLNNIHDGTIVLTNNKAITLNYYKDKGYFIYTDSTNLHVKGANKNFEPNDDIDEYQKLAETSLTNDFGIDMSKYKYNYYSYIHYPNPHGFVVNSKTDAGAVRFIYEQVVDNVPVVSDYKLFKNNQISVTIGQDKIIKRIDAKLAADVIKTNETVSLKNKEEIEEAIVSGSASLIDVNKIMAPSDIITSSDINSVKIIYLTRDSKIVPVYELRGKLSTSLGQTLDGTFYLNAVKN